MADQLPGGTWRGSTAPRGAVRPAVPGRGFPAGALNAVWRRCGKPNCACARPGHRGHGPQWNLTRRIGGKTVNTHLKPGPELEKARREVAEHQRFLGLVEEVTAVSEAICAARPVTAAVAPPPAEGERGGS